MPRLRYHVPAILAAFLLLGCGKAPLEGRPTTDLARPASSPATAPASPIDLLAMGDWGEDTAAQRRVAGAMESFARPLHDELTSVLLLGDNFYFKLAGTNDPRWQSVFENVYDIHTLDRPFYACLGNHDYDGQNLNIELAYARLHPDGRFKLPAEWYRVELPAEHPVVTVIMLDSNRDNLTDAQWNAQIAWLRKELAGPRATWTICCAHHPLFSNGFFWGNGVLQKDWGKLFQEFGVDFYLCGHEHDMEHLEIPGWHTSFVISGGGGAHSHPLSRDDRGFSREAFGFVSLELTADKAVVRYIGEDGRPMHVFERTKAGVVTVRQTTPNTRRTNPLKAYLDMKERKPAATQP